MADHEPAGEPAKGAAPDTPSPAPPHSSGAAPRVAGARAAANPEPATGQPAAPDPPPARPATGVPAAATTAAKPAAASGGSAASAPAAAPNAPAAPGTSGGASAPKPAAAGPAAPKAPIAPSARPAAAAKPAAGDAPLPDTSPLLSRRAWIGLAWGAFSAATAASLAATGRFMFPNVLNEPPQQFKAGFPADYNIGVDERWKEKFGVWLVRTTDDIVHHAPGFYAIISTCTHLGCTPNYLSAENKFKCPCHGSGFRITGINFEGPAPRPLERARCILADDGQILVDKGRKFQYELGQWQDPESFLKA